MSKSTDQWFTPPRECEMVRLALGGTIDLDPCGHPRAHVRALRIVFEQEDGFRLSWRRYSRIFCNPPYSDPAPWAARCRRHAMIDGGDAESLRDLDEIRRRLELRGEQPLAVEQRLLLVHEAK